jgi:hypothetical protein
MKGATPVSNLTRNGTDGRVYGGDPNLIHVPDGTRADVGARAAAFVENEMRQGAENRTERQREMQRLCPGCFMVVGFNMLLRLADDTGQDRRELARSMIHAFEQLLANPDAPPLEEIFIQLDPPDCNIEQLKPNNGEVIAIDRALAKAGLEKGPGPFASYLKSDARLLDEAAAASLGEMG